MNITKQLYIIKHKFHMINNITKSIFQLTAERMSDSDNVNDNAKCIATQPKTYTKNKVRWIVTAPPTKPIYDLERGWQKINESPLVVSARLDHSLRLRSVEATFDSNRAEATCKTSNFLRYKIYLYTGNDKGNNDSTLIQIIKVNNGCGFEFTKEYEAVINAAKGLGGSLQRSVKALSSMAMTMTLPPDFLDLYEPPSDADIEDSLDRIIDQIHSKHDNAVLFALQNLHSITTEDKHYSETSNRASMYVIKNYNGIRDMITKIYANRVGDIWENEKSDQICHASLIVLMNGIQQSLPPPGKNMSSASFSITDDRSKHFIEQLVPSLLDGVRNYSKNAHTACLAMECLYLLAMNSPLARTEIGEVNDISVAVEGAKLYGSTEHLKLEKAASSMMEILQSQISTHE